MADHKNQQCKKFCNASCMDYGNNLNLLSECLNAVSTCDCRTLWQKPVFVFLVGFAIFIAVAACRMVILWNSGHTRNTIIVYPSSTSPVGNQRFGSSARSYPNNTQRPFIVSGSPDKMPYMDPPPSYNECVFSKV